MAEGPPERPGRTPLSHLVVPWPASDQAYRGRSGGAAKPIRAIGDRQSHAARLSGELESARDAARAKLAEVSPDVVADGFALSVESWSDEPGYKLAVQSLDTSGAKLLSVMPGHGPVARACRGLAAVRRGRGVLHEDRAVRHRDHVPGQSKEPGARGQHRRPAPRGAARPVAGTRAVPRGRRGPLVGGVAGTSRADACHPEKQKGRRWILPAPSASRSGPGAVLRAVAAERAWQVVPGVAHLPGQRDRVGPRVGV